MSEVMMYKVLNGARKAVTAFNSGDVEAPFQWPQVGEWTDPVDHVEACVSGYHLTSASGIHQWVSEGMVVYEAEGRGTEDTSEYKECGKVAYESSRLTRKVGVATREAILRALADAVEASLGGPDEAKVVPDAEQVIEAARGGDYESLNEHIRTVMRTDELETRVVKALATMLDRLNRGISINLTQGDMESVLYRAYRTSVGWELKIPSGYDEFAGEHFSKNLIKYISEEVSE